LPGSVFLVGDFSQEAMIEEERVAAAPRAKSSARCGNDSFGETIRPQCRPLVNEAVFAIPPPYVHVLPVVGGAPEAVLTLGDVRQECPVLRTAFVMAEELYQET